MFQHLRDTYESETAKTASVWRCFRDEDLGYRIHAKSSSVLDIFRHQLLSERRFFAEFIGFEEPPAAELLPAGSTVEGFTRRFEELGGARFEKIGAAGAEFWSTRVRFFDVERERIWVFWRRVLHSAHHRTQLTLYLRMLDRPVPSTYGPTADVTWSGADPTTTLAASARGSK